MHEYNYDVNTKLPAILTLAIFFLTLQLPDLIVNSPFYLLPISL